MNLQNIPNLSIDDKDEYIKSLESAIEKLRKENKALIVSKEKITKGLKGSNQSTCKFFNFNEINSILDALHSEINSIFPVIESTLLFLESDKIIRINDIAVSEKMINNIDNLEEQGIFDWVSTLDTPKIIPNFNLESTDTGKSFLLVPLSLHQIKTVIFIASTDKLQSELTDNISSAILNLSVSAALSIDYLKQKNQNEILTNKLDNLEKAIIDNAGQISIAEITSAVSLELDDPIKVISGHLEMLENGIGNPATRLKTIQSQFDKIKKVANKIKTIDDNNSQTEIHDITIIIKDAINLISSQMKKEGIEFKINIDINKPNIKCKINLFTQLFLDIFLFQRSRMPDGGQITLTISNQGNKINISIIDNGIGLDKDEKQSIFEPFKSEDRLNLFFAKQITHIHKGKIQLITDSNSGNSIKIQFPVFDL